MRNEEEIADIVRRATESMGLIISAMKFEFCTFAGLSSDEANQIILAVVDSWMDGPAMMATKMQNSRHKK